MPPPCAACAAPAAPLACARCKCAFYCGAACQRAAWGAHKGGCVAGAADALPRLTKSKSKESVRCSTCGAAGVLTGCSGCCCAPYCDVQCQRAALGAHRDACRAAAAAPKLYDACEQSRCSHCGCETPFYRSLCGRCRSVAYCGEACARAYWRGGHRGACAAAGAALFKRTVVFSDAGSPSAMFMLGIYYASGVGIGADAAAAVEWYRRAAEAGHAKAHHALGSCYRDGKGVAADEVAAAKCFARGADAGDATSMASLAFCYGGGEGVVADVDEAVALFERAAEAGNAISQHLMGSRYLVGNKRDIAKAREWFSRAAAGGCAAAFEDLAKLDAAALLRSSRQEMKAADLARPN